MTLIQYAQILVDSAGEMERRTSPGKVLLSRNEAFALILPGVGKTNDPGILLKHRAECPISG